MIGIGVLAVLFLSCSSSARPKEDEDAEERRGDRAPGGFPVPPMPAGGAVRGAAGR